MSARSSRPGLLAGRSCIRVIAPESLGYLKCLVRPPKASFRWGSGFSFTTRVNVLEASKFFEDREGNTSDKALEVDYPEVTPQRNINSRT